MAKTCYLVELGRVPYAEALEIQERLVELRLADRIPDVLLLLEHEPVVTLGRRASEDEDFRATRAELEGRGIKVFETGRGGRATYHGPGQLVGYPIIGLPGGKTEVASYMDKLCQVMISALEQYGVTATLDKGVWVNDEKIGATGAQVISRNGKHVTMHGFALNVNIDLSAFDLIVPCGMPDKKPTSLEQLLGRQVPMDEIARLITGTFKEQFGYDSLQRMTLQEIDKE